MYCDNEIKKEEMDNIYRIEYMPSSNWDQGRSRIIWVVEFEDITGDDFPKRSVYTGDPLVPEYSKFNTVQDNFQEVIAEEKTVFCNHYRSYHYAEILDELEVWNWKNLEADDQIYDGMNLDIAFFTKDSDGNDKICRYFQSESTLSEQLTERLNDFFETMSIDQVETVVLNKEMKCRSKTLLPGNHEDKEI